jgi:hypothetical protein
MKSISQHFRPALATIAAAAAVLLAACGGGGGGGSSAPVATSSPAPATPNGPTSLTLTATPAVSLTAADCARLQSDAVAQATLDLSNPQFNRLNSLLQQVDPDFAWRVFLRWPSAFVNWVAGQNGGVVTAMTVGAAAHETFHGISFALTSSCAPVNTYKTTFFGTTYSTDLVLGATPPYGIAAGALPAGLRSGMRYATYVGGSLGTVSGNGFNALLDELAAYVGNARTEAQWIRLQGDEAGTLDSGVGGTVDFMAFTIAYLQAVRVNNPAAWATINNSASTKALLQAVWTKAEDVLADAHPLTLPSATRRFIYNQAAFDYIYQTASLNELVLLGINTRARSSWVGSYL